jgi:phosphomannomutase
MSSDLDALLDQARAWLEDDPDPDTVAELDELIIAVEEKGSESDAAVELTDQFSGTLEFGTAGLRGALGPGPNRMNRVVVSRAAAGLVRYLQDNGAGESDAVVIGYDARHKSDVFAADTAEIVTGAGMRALLLPQPLPTPVLAYAILRLGCVAGVMVTASHNPPQDNGYKVYLGDGSQIVPPADTEISARIAQVGPMATIPRATTYERLDDRVVRDYLRDTASIVDPAGPRDISVVYTPLHGVGGSTVESAMRLAGFHEPRITPAQAEPDADFPTVAFPNPEEPGAMDLALRLAVEADADLVVANDPDADRCAVAVPSPDGWRMLRGDEVGALLADFLLRSGVQGVYATSIVSSSLLSRMAAAHGQPYQETLTGFKWIGRIPDLAFGYEEALGYCVDPARVKDKDGVSALLRVAELAALLKSDGLTLQDRLDEIARTYGVHATDQVSVRVEDRSAIPATIERFRSSPPTSLGGLDVEAVDDLAVGSPDLPPTNGLRFHLSGGARLIMRPSGTEPKLKCYLEVVISPEESARGLAGARTEARRLLDALKSDLSARIAG